MSGAEEDEEEEEEDVYWFTARFKQIIMSFYETVTIDIIAVLIYIIVFDLKPRPVISGRGAEQMSARLAVTARVTFYTWQNDNNFYRFDIYVPTQQHVFSGRQYRFYYNDLRQPVGNSFY